MIREVFHVAADNSDLLAAPSRLAAIPYDGVLSVELQGHGVDGTDTNKVTYTIELPDGSAPVIDQMLTGGTTAFAIDDRTETLYQFGAYQGGHFLLSFAVAGTGRATVVVTLAPP